MNKWEIARKIASHFGHLWPDWVAPGEEDKIAQLSKAEAYEMWRSRNPGAHSSRWKLSAHQRPALSGQTTTGRLEWSVNDKGGVTIAVYRPDPIGLVLVVYRCPTGRLDIEQHNDCFIRHLEAAFEVLRALAEMSA